MTSERVCEPYSDTFQEVEQPFSIRSEQMNNIREHRNNGASTSNDRQCDVDATTLPSRLGVSHHIASETLNNTTQLAPRTEPFTRRLRTRQSQTWYPRLGTYVYSDMFFSATASKPRNNLCAQLFTTSQGFCQAYPMKTKGDASDKLNSFVTTYGIPLGLVTNGVKEENLRKWEEVRKKFFIPQRTTEPHTLQQNRTEIEIRETKDHYCRIMYCRRVPAELWDFGITYTTDV